MAYQVLDRAWAGVSRVGVRCGSATLDFGLAARGGSRMGLLVLLALQGAEANKKQYTPPIWSPSHPGSQRKANSLAWTWRCQSPRLCQ